MRMGMLLLLLLGFGVGCRLSGSNGARWEGGEAREVDRAELEMEIRLAIEEADRVEVREEGGRSPRMAEVRDPALVAGLARALPLSDVRVGSARQAWQVTFYREQEPLLDLYVMEGGAWGQDGEPVGESTEAFRSIVEDALEQGEPAPPPDPATFGAADRIIVWRRMAGKSRRRTVREPEVIERVVRALRKGEGESAEADARFGLWFYRGRVRLGKVYVRADGEWGIGDLVCGRSEDLLAWCEEFFPGSEAGSGSRGTGR